jgi:signal transduction histidine kinase
MSHELRTPLNSIIGYSELILAVSGESLEPVTRGNLEVVLRNGRHLLGLINEILDIARIEAGKTSVYATTFDPRLVLGGILDSTLPLAAEKGLVLDADLSPEVELAETDETRVRQIVLNLLSNAIKFSTEGEIRVSLRPAGADRMEIRVSDTGIGIAKEQQEAIFEEFSKVESPQADESTGTGLGLAISRKLARLLGGDLTVESALNQGSTFKLELPLRFELAESSGVPA